MAPPTNQFQQVGNFVNNTALPYEEDNSLKYGALSSPGGTLDISCAPHDTDVTVVWTERGGPPVVAPAGEGGYGSKLLNRGMTVQLGGSITCDWAADGIIVALQMSKDRLTR